MQQRCHARHGWAGEVPTHVLAALLSSCLVKVNKNINQRSCHIQTHWWYSYCGKRWQIGIQVHLSHPGWTAAMIWPPIQGFGKYQWKHSGTIHWLCEFTRISIVYFLIISYVLNILYVNMIYNKFMYAYSCVHFCFCFFQRTYLIFVGILLADTKNFLYSPI